MVATIASIYEVNTAARQISEVAFVATGMQTRYIEIVAPRNFFLLTDTVTFSPGTNAFATISLSNINTLFDGSDPNPKFAAVAWIDSWTVYNPDGSESPPEGGDGFRQNAAWVRNCARINFKLAGQRVWAISQASISFF
jgi:hypothetical protein